jgi:predicted phage-related endonuclease
MKRIEKETIKKMVGQELEFYDFLSYDRSKTIGASEVAGILYHSQYADPLEICLRKLGYTEVEDNAPMFWGRIKESIIAEVLQYYDFKNEMAYIENYKKNKIMIDVYMLGETIVNKKYPFLSCTPDGYFIENGELGVVELKTINEWNANKWETGVPPEYLLQIQQQMLVVGVNKGILALLIGSSRFVVYKIEKDLEIQETIIKFAEEFDAKLKEIRTRLDAEGINPMPGMVPPSWLADYFPTASDEIRYEVLKKYFKPIKETAVGDPSDMELLEKFIEMNKEIKDIEGKQAEIKRRIKEKYVEYEAVDYGLRGKVYLKDKFLVKLKIK